MNLAACRRPDTPAGVRRVQERRRGGSAGPHEDQRLRRQRTRGAARRVALRETAL